MFMQLKKGKMPKSGEFSDYKNTQKDVNNLDGSLDTEYVNHMFLLVHVRWFQMLKTIRIDNAGTLEQGSD